MHWLRRNPQAVAYVLIVFMLVGGFTYSQRKDESDRRASMAARAVVCKLINKRDIQQTQDLIDVAQAGRAAAIAKGDQPQPTPEEERQYQAGITAFLAKAKARAINCSDFAAHPEKYLDDTRVRSALADRVQPLLTL